MHRVRCPVRVELLIQRDCHQLDKHYGLGQFNKNYLFKNKKKIEKIKLKKLLNEDDDGRGSEGFVDQLYIVNDGYHETSE